MCLHPVHPEGSEIAADLTEVGHKPIVVWESLPAEDDSSQVRSSVRLPVENWRPTVSFLNREVNAVAAQAHPPLYAVVVAGVLYIPIAPPGGPSDLLELFVLEDISILTSDRERRIDVTDGKRATAHVRTGAPCGSRNPGKL